MCKSSTLAFVLIFAFLFKLEQPRLRLIAIIVIITAGVVLMVSDETDFVVVGYVRCLTWLGGCRIGILIICFRRFVEVMAGAVLGGLRWSLTEILLRKESLGLSNPCASIFYLAPAQGIILIVISGFVEGYFNIFQSAFFLTFKEGLHTVRRVSNYTWLI
jgi:solute carrier family 35, member C2